LVGRIARLDRRELARAVGGTIRALARRKLEAPPDAGHEPREGETVRGTALTIAKEYALVRLVGFGSQALDTTEDVLGLSPFLPSRASRREVLGSKVNRSSISASLARERSVGRTAHRSAQRLVGRALG
jgi:hypothetical protein